MVDFDDELLHPSINMEEVETAQPATSNARFVNVTLPSGEYIELDLDELDDSQLSLDTLTDLLVKEHHYPPEVWVKFIADYWRRFGAELAFRIAQWGLDEQRKAKKPEMEVPLLCLMATYNLALARSAPTLVLPDARQDHLPSGVTRSQYYQKATAFINQAERIDASSHFVLDAKGAMFLAMGKLDDAMRTFDRVLNAHPTHIPATLGKARILVARRQHRSALRLYQNVLTTAPDTLPDPRIGIGICYYHLGERDLARRAWQRSMVVNPGKESMGATVLLGLFHLNAGRHPNLDENDRAVEYEEGINHLQQVWKAEKTNASAASGLAGHFLTMRQWPTAIKLGERAIQYADSRAALSEGNLILARALHAENKLNEAASHYLKAAEKTPDQLVAAIAAAQIIIARKEYPAALNSFENILRQHPGSIEALVNVAGVHAHSAFTSTSSSDAEAERKRAMEIYEQVLRIIAPRLLDTKAGMANGEGETPANAPPRVREVGSNPDLYTEIARLWSDSDPQRALRAYREAARAKGEDQVTSAILNNIGCLEYSRGEYAEAASCFEQALTKISMVEPAQQDGTGTTLVYNLAAAYEGMGDTDKAIEMYERRLLTRHPEYIDAKCRLALVYLRRREIEKAHDLLKAALTSQPQHIELRALYTYFLIETNDTKNAKEFTIGTLQSHRKDDVYAMCAGGILEYQRARENKATGHEAAKDRASRYLRAAEFFDTALKLDPMCAVAAQGVAIALAEGTLGVGNQTTTGPNGQTTTISESQRRLKNSRDALQILTKVREAVREGSVYVNIGHCHFAREEWDRAIESYETASKRYYGGKNVQVLLHVARAWFFKAIKDERFSAMTTALASARAAHELSPRDDTIRFNIALIQHRGLEILNALDDEKNEAKLAKRSVKELEQAIAEVTEAQATFAELAEKKAKNVAYSVDIANQRVSFGRTLLARARDSIPRQAEYEAREEAKAQNARDHREQVRARQAEAEVRFSSLWITECSDIDMVARAIRLAEIKQRAADLAAQRLAAQEEASSWYVAPTEEELAEEARRKGKKKRSKKDSGVEGFVVAEDDEKPDAGRDEATASEDDGEEKPKRKRAKPTKKAKAEAPGSEEDEDDNALRPTKKSRKNFKSTEMVVDSDDD